ncbi:periplasmic substrate-binding protein/sensor histidine kinase [Marinomonas sp. MED121]|uniref:transporter substrate-binding domain-containing protein n=1 Tax=Marinomonas sp. MED121 TaxID=314277 RepID=UPI00006904EF|nr:transporter substrate-binding domain-containing protein [Marinomonas sp. MED121]EAQ64702.1 periplasmic substrate-binding protein/sensor histidine kinase [Marinomonas sp. MED121]
MTQLNRYLPKFPLVTITTFLTCALLLMSQQLMAEIDNKSGMQKPVFVVGADHSYPPYEFVNQYGEPDGYTVELTLAIAELMGFEVEFRMSDWKTALKGLYQEDVDVLQGIAYSVVRAQTISFSPPHSIVNQSIFARDDSPNISNVSMLKDKEVIVQNASIMHEYLINEDIGAKIIPAPTHLEALRLLAAGKHDFALIANLPSLYLTKEMGLNNIYPISSPVQGQRLGYGVLPKNEALISRFTEGLAILKNTGRQQEIYEKWLGSLEKKGLPWDIIAQIVGIAASLLLLTLAGIVVWNSMLRKEVEKRSSQIHEQQQQLIQADKMASLGVLVSGVAHEINNPTGLLMLNLPLLKEAWIDALPKLEAHAQEHGEFKLAGLSFNRIKQELPYLLDEMDQGTIRIRNIVNDLKDFARSEPDEIKQEVDINKVIQTAVRLVDKSIRTATDEFELNLQDQHLLIMGSAQRIEQVMINLIINACDALDSKGQRIRVSSELNQSNTQVIIKVEDQGGGIDENLLPRLTDPFFTTKRELGGTGLGLSVSASIVQAHEGSMTFDSVKLLGTTVTICLPCYMP